MNYRHISIVAALLLLGGCQHYYMVQDPTGGKTFYTDKIDQMDSGAVVFKDTSDRPKIDAAKLRGEGNQ